MEKKELVSVLREQHKNLSKKITECLHEAVKDNPDYETVFSVLRKFNEDLGEHLNLENNVFYPELLRYLSSKGMPTSGMEKFIKMMMEIQADVVFFADKYDSSNKIEESRNGFTSGLKKMIASLSVRMETEEDCAYIYLE
jgi:hypothetical protein